MRLAGAGRRVTRAGARAGARRRPAPGCRAGGGYRFDTGPTVLTMPDLIADCFDALGERMDGLARPAAGRAAATGPVRRRHARWTSTPAPRRWRPRSPGSCGPAEAAGFRRYVDFVSRAVPLRDAGLHRPQHRLPARPAVGEPRPAGGASAASAGWRRRSSSTCRTRGRSGCTRSRRCTPGCRRTTRSRSTPSSPTWTRSPGVFFPAGGMHAVPEAMAAAAEKHGVEIRYSTEVDRGRARRRARRRRPHRGGRADRVRRRRAEPRPARRLPRAAGLEPRRLKRLSYSPSCYLLLAGSTAPYDAGAHHTISFGESWRAGVRRAAVGPADERPVDPGHEPDPVGPLARARRAAHLLRAVPDAEPRRADRLVAGRPACTASTCCGRSTPAGRQGSPTGSRSSASRPRRTGPTAGWSGALRSRPPTRSARRARSGRGNLWGENVVFTGSGTQPGVGVPMVLVSGRLAAERVLGRDRSYRSRAWR